MSVILHYSYPESEGTITMIILHFKNYVNFALHNYYILKNINSIVVTFSEILLDNT